MSWKMDQKVTEQSYFDKLTIKYYMSKNDYNSNFGGFSKESACLLYLNLKWTASLSVLEIKYFNTFKCHVRELSVVYYFYYAW